MGYRKFEFSKSSWDAKASDYSNDVITNPPVGETKNIGSVGSISDLFRDRFETIATFWRCKPDSRRQEPSRN